MESLFLHHAISISHVCVIAASENCLLSCADKVYFVGRKCTYGKKCKYFHPECPRTISEKLVGKKSDNGRKKSKQVEAIAKKWIKQQHQAPSTSSVVTSREEVSQVSQL